MSAQRWQTFTPQQQAIIRDAAQASYQQMNGLWRDFETKVRTEAEAMGVRFSRPDKAPFIERAAPLARDFAEERVIGELMQKIARS